MNDSTEKQELLLTEDPTRYVMFPIKDSEIWDMYKRQVDCFGGQKRLIYLKIWQAGLH